MSDGLLFCHHAFREGELVTVFRTLTGVDLGPPREYALSKSIKKLGSRRPGAVYKYEQVDDRHIRFLEDYPMDRYTGPEVAEWRTLDYAALQQATVVKTLKEDDPMLAPLAPIRAALRQLPAPQRAQVLARVVGYLVK
jgi:hypothetical protein